MPVYTFFNLQTIFNPPQVSATDADEGTNGAIYYEITSGNTDNAFAIDHVTGIVTTAKSLDYEIEDSYVLTVIAKDGGSPQLTGTATMRIGIVDVNDNQPVFVQMDPVSVSEGGYKIGISIFFFFLLLKGYNLPDFS